MKTSHRLFTFGFIISAATVTFATERIEMTYGGLQKMLETRSARIAASKVETEAAKSRTGYLTRSFLPSLSLQAAQENFKVGRGVEKTQPLYGAELNLNIYNAGRDSNESKLRDLNLEKKTVEQQRVTSEELQKVRNLFWDILFTQEKLKLLESTIKINGQNLGSADRRVRNGVATESDRVEFEMKAVELKRELSEAQFELIEDKNEMMIILNIPESSELAFPDVIAHEHEIDPLLKHSDKDHKYLYKENKLKAEASQLAAKNVNRSWWPKLDAFAAYNQYNEREKEFVDPKDRTETVLGVRVSMNLADGWEGRRESAALLKEAEALQTIANMQKRETEVHLKNEFAKLQLLHDQVHDAEQNIARADKYFKLTHSEYVRGVKNSPDVLGASDKIFEMKIKKFEIIRDFQNSKAHILSKIGK